MEKVCAIIPAFNEEQRISNVLDVLVDCKILDEIIVIDDGSKDRTKDIVKLYGRRIKYIKNLKNKGKGFCMDLGVKKTKCGIIFFCDADLKNLSKKIVENIISPVLNNEFEMFLGLRNIKFKKYQLMYLSGQRALKREVWERMPNFYKKNFRVELGMNFYAKSIGKKVFNYSQTLKEAKYGLLYGSYRRLFMNLDIVFTLIIIGLIKALNPLKTFFKNSLNIEIF